MNITKSKGMIVSKKEMVPEIKINIEGKNIQQVKEMIYLGFMATENGKCERDNRCQNYLEHHTSLRFKGRPLTQIVLILSGPFE